MEYALWVVGFLLAVVLLGLWAMTRPQAGTARWCARCGRQRAKEGSYCPTCHSQLILLAPSDEE